MPASSPAEPSAKCGRVIRPALVAQAIEQRGALQPERLDPRAHGIQPHALQQRVRGQGVARRGGQHGEIDQRQRRRLEVLPDPADGDALDR